jgi:dTMP kinase
MARPLFITFEGIEGSGKSTQAALLSAYLRNLQHEVLSTREPGGSKLAEEIRNLVLSGGGIKDPMTEFLLFSAARRDHVETAIKPALAAGKWVVCDRFIDSSKVYQGYVKGLDLKVMDQLITLTIGDFRPDITLVIDTDIEAALARLAKSRANQNHYDKAGADFFNKVRDGFLDLSRKEDRINVIDGNLPQEEVHKKVLETLGL